MNWPDFFPQWSSEEIPQCFIGPQVLIGCLLKVTAIEPDVVLKAQNSEPVRKVRQIDELTPEVGDLPQW